MIILNKFIGRYSGVMTYAASKNVDLYVLYSNNLSNSKCPYYYNISRIGKCNSTQYFCIANNTNNHLIWYIKNKLKLGYNVLRNLLIIYNVEVAKMLNVRNLYAKYKYQIFLSNDECINICRFRSNHLENAC